MRASAGEPLPYRVLGDQPYAVSDDPFGFGELARELRSLILSSRSSTPFAIGIEASWGRGKSTLMAQLARELAVSNGAEGDVQIRTVSFNAWTAEGDDVLEGLVKSVLEAMDPNILRRALRRRRLVSAAKIPLLLVASWLRVGALVNEAWDKLSVDAHTRNQVNDLVREAMMDWFEQTRRTTADLSPDRLLVVFIDDLDRCSPENVMKVFEGLKLYLDAPGFVFVIGYDEGVISEAVADQKQYSTRSTGRDYIEKIVQIVFRIPQPTDQEVGGLLTTFLDDSGTGSLFDDAGRKLVIERNGRNPRRMKRFVNRFILDYQLDEASQDLEAELLIKLLIFETYFPEFSRLFNVAEGKNPIQEFLDFTAARDALRRGVGTEPIVDSVFTFYGIAPGESAQQSLERLQAEAPEPFVRLVQQDDFVSLARSLEDADDQTLILAKVQRRKERETHVPLVESSPKGVGVPLSGDVGRLTPVPSVSGRRLLWVDDKPEKNIRIVDALRSEGAEIEIAQSGEAAAEILHTFEPDLLVSNIGRGGLQDAGFEDLVGLRSRELYNGPVIFSTARVTGSRRNRAKDLGAPIVSGEEELFKEIAKTFAPQVVSGGDPATSKASSAAVSA